MLLRITMLAMIVVGAAGCSDSEDDPTTGSQSHWLTACDGDAACGDELSCVCGVCTLSCQGDSSCEGGDTAARCVEGVEVPDGLCGGSAGQPADGICLPECASDADCGGAGFACVSGSCVPVPESCPACDECGSGYTTVLSLGDDGCVQCQCTTSALACGTAGSCDWPVEYCDVVTPGIPEDETQYTCLPMPDACRADATCACLSSEVPEKDCREGEDGATLSIDAP